MADFKVTFLGTSSATPTKESVVATTSVQFAGEIFLVDCAEGAQQRMMQSKTSMFKVKNLTISHWHGDHFFGLPGFLNTLNLLGRREELNLWVPSKAVAKKFVDFMGLSVLGFKVSLHELREGVVYEKDNFTVSAVRLKHSIPSFGFVFTQSKGRKFNKQKAIALGVPEGPLFSALQKGEAVKLEGGGKVKPSQVLEGQERVKKVAVIADTVPIPSLAARLRDCDLLVHETTFSEKEKERARKTKHSTAVEVAKLAKKARAGQLIGTHVSARYDDRSFLEKEMQSVFANSRIARDLESVEV